MRTVKVEGELIQSLLQVSITELDKMRDETAKTLEPDLLVSRIVSFTSYTVQKIFL